MKALKTIGIIFFAVILLIIAADSFETYNVMSSMTPEERDQRSAEMDRLNQERIERSQREALEAKSWRYETKTDPMTSNETRTATLRSTNSLSLGFPYDGRNYGFIQVRQHPRFGLDVIISVEKGQIMCRTGECNVTVRFGEAQPVVYSGSEPADNSSNIVFINNARGFINNASRAEKILVQMSFFQSGTHILTFDPPEPLKWN